MSVLIDKSLFDCCLPIPNKAQQYHQKSQFEENNSEKI